MFCQISNSNRFNDGWQWNHLTFPSEKEDEFPKICLHFHFIRSPFSTWNGFRPLFSAESLAQADSQKNVGFAVNGRRSDWGRERVKKQILPRQCCRSSLRNLCCGNFSRPSLPHTHSHSPRNDSVLMSMPVCVLVYPNTIGWIGWIHGQTNACVFFAAYVCVFSDRDQPSTTTNTATAPTAAAAQWFYSSALTACVCFTCCLLARWFARHGGCNVPPHYV